ncbi:MAG: hypothetical protein FJ405_15435 [Verrucomicrobia bacterium]|nr:hypothetical protein [Verrucomicrobiota bacterium]
MKTKKNRWNTTQPRNTGYPAESRKTAAENFARLKDRMLFDALRRTDNALLRDRYQWAAQDAAALAFVTPWPSLFFPGIFSEKLLEARQWVARQHAISLRSRHEDG